MSALMKLFTMGKHECVVVLVRRDADVTTAKLNKPCNDGCDYATENINNIFLCVLLSTIYVHTQNFETETRDRIVVVCT